jgi:hypothetical protein
MRAFHFQRGRAVQVTAVLAAMAFVLGIAASAPPRAMACKSTGATEPQFTDYGCNWGSWTACSTNYTQVGCSFTATLTCNNVSNGQPGCDFGDQETTYYLCTPWTEWDYASGTNLTKHKNAGTCNTTNTLSGSYTSSCVGPCSSCQWQIFVQIFYGTADYGFSDGGMDAKTTPAFSCRSCG